MNTTLTIKVQKKLRDDAKKTAEKLGLPLTTVIHAMLKQFVLDQEITLSANVPNAETRRAMQDLHKRKNVETFETFEQWQKAMRAI
jgi:addiction module RelB/DinJ family antitoxin